MTHHSLINHLPFHSLEMTSDHATIDNAHTAVITKSNPKPMVPVSTLKIMPSAVVHGSTHRHRIEGQNMQCRQIRAFATRLFDALRHMIQIASVARMQGAQSNEESEKTAPKR